MIIYLWKKLSDCWNPKTKTRTYSFDYIILCCKILYLWIRSKYSVIEWNQIACKEIEIHKNSPKIPIYRKWEKKIPNYYCWPIPWNFWQFICTWRWSVSAYMRVCCGKFHGHRWFFEMKFSTYIIFLQFFICCWRLDTFTFKNKVVQPNPLCILCKKCFVVHNNNESTMGIIALDKQLTFVKKLLRCIFFEKKKPTKPNQVRKRTMTTRSLSFLLFLYATLCVFHNNPMGHSTLQLLRRTNSCLIFLSPYIFSLSSNIFFARFDNKKKH